MIKKVLVSFSVLLNVIAFGQIPSLAIQSQNQNENLPIHNLSINVDVVGNISKTTFDITFYNPYNRILEGDFSFPLLEGQDVCRYALDINGNLREGVVVEKVKARQAYEAVVRQNIDPGIVSKTKGNFYKTRIYPIPSKGYKRVVFAIEQILPIVEDQLHYELPMAIKDAIGTFCLQVNVIKSRKKPKLSSDAYSDFEFDEVSEIHQLNFKREAYVPNKKLDFKVPFFGDKEEVVYTESYKGKTYFYASFKTPKFETIEKKTPKNIAIYWDASFSGEERDTEAELQLLQQYLEGIEEQKKVVIRIFKLNEILDKEFRVGKDADQLISFMKSIQYDGATRLENLDFSGAYDEILFFSDGIATVGAEEIVLPKTPIYSFSSSAGANYSLLKYLATKTNGKYFKVSKYALAATLQAMHTTSSQYLAADFSENDFQEVVVSPFTNASGYFAISGIVSNPEAAITLNFGRGKNTSWSKTITIQTNTIDQGIIPRVWARFKINDLDMQYQKHKEQITNLGKEYAIVTRNTSFIVLDRIEDYVTHQIVPPKELLKEYEKLVARQTKNKEKDDGYIQSTNQKYLNVLKDWYTSDFPPESIRIKEMARDTEARRRMSEAEAARRSAESRVGRSIPAPPTPPEIIDVVEDEYEVEEIVVEEVAFEESTSSQKISKREKSTSKPKIKLLAWQPEAPYLDSLQNASAKDLIPMYYRLKRKNQAAPSFFIEVADFLFKNKDKKHAVLVLSNLLEMDLENAELLKVVARRLLDENQNELAIAVYKEIVELRPEEPQSHRDLALAHIQNKEYQKALDLFNKILNTKWDRFGSIKEIVLNEMNSLVAKHKDVLDLSETAKDLIYEMPVDVRIVIDWSSNDNDIDLWVTDPQGEKCSYQNKRTKIGGRMTTDIRNGYGPEEFTLKKALRGFYTVYVNYYSDSRQRIVGPVTVYAKMYTKYGSKDQEMKTIALQLETGKKTLQIGQLEF